MQAASPEQRLRLRQFNRIVSSVRARVEQAFGMLKGRFPALKDFGPTETMQDTYRAVEALMVMHNLCVDMGDEPFLIPFFDPVDEAHLPDEVAPGRYGGGVDNSTVADLPAHETDEWLKQAGFEMRERILNAVVPL